MYLFCLPDVQAPPVRGNLTLWTAHPWTCPTAHFAGQRVCHQQHACREGLQSQQVRLVGRARQWCCADCGLHILCASCAQPLSKANMTLCMLLPSTVHTGPSTAASGAAAAHQRGVAAAARRPAACSAHCSLLWWVRQGFAPCRDAACSAPRAGPNAIGTDYVAARDLRRWLLITAAQPNVHNSIC